MEAGRYMSKTDILSEKYVERWKMIQRKRNLEDRCTSLRKGFTDEEASSTEGRNVTRAITRNTE